MKRSKIQDVSKIRISKPGDLEKQDSEEGQDDGQDGGQDGQDGQDGNGDGGDGDDGAGDGGSEPGGTSGPGQPGTSGPGRPGTSGIGQPGGMSGQGQPGEGEGGDGSGGNAGAMSPEDMGLPGQDGDSGKKPSNDGTPSSKGGVSDIGTDRSQQKPGELSPSEKLGDEYMEKIERGMEEPQEWNIGEVEGGDPSGGAPVLPGDGIEGLDGTGEEEGGMKKQQDDEEEGREWDRAEFEKKIDEAAREVIRNKPQGREAKVQQKKGRGKGSSASLRDRLVIESLSKINWAQIFKTRLTEYSREKIRRIPYHRKHVTNKMLGRRIGSSVPGPNALPETNIIIDTSSSLSYAELEVILAEVQKAISSAKIERVNLMLWHQDAYFHKSYDKVNSYNFKKIIKDVDNNWQGGSNDITKVYKKMKKLGWSNKFTLHFTDGWINDHTVGETQKLSNDVLDPNNTIFGLITDKAVDPSWWEDMKRKFPGEKIPIFKDTDKFR